MASPGRSLIGARNISVGRGLTGLLLILIVSGCSQWSDAQERRATERLAEKKYWPTEIIGYKLAVTVATAWRDGRALYEAELRAYSGDSNSLTDDASLTLVFSDVDGFKLWEKRIPFADMTRMVDSSNVVTGTGFSWSGGDFVAADTYQRAAVMGVVWSSVSGRKPVP
jgi:hypothetical protein